MACRRSGRRASPRPPRPARGRHRSRRGRLVAGQGTRRRCDHAEGPGRSRRARSRHTRSRQRSRRTTRTSSSTRAGLRGRPRVPCSRTGPMSCARCPVRSSSRAGPWSVPTPSSTWGRGRSPCNSGRRATPSSSSSAAGAPEIGEAVERHRATRLNCVPAVWTSTARRKVGRGSDVHDLSSIRFADTGTSATPPRVAASHRRGTAACAGAGLLRVHRGGRRDRPRACRHRAQARQLRRARAAHHRARGRRRVDCGCADRCCSTAISTTPRRRPRRSSTGGTTPAIWPRRTTRDTSPSSGAPGT